MFGRLARTVGIRQEPRGADVPGARRRVVIWDPENQMAEMPVFKADGGNGESETKGGGGVEPLGGGVELIMRPVGNPPNR